MSDDSDYSDVDTSDEQSGEETEQITDLSSEVVVTKYRLASDITNKALKAVVAKAVAGARAVDLCKTGDAVVEEDCAKLFKKEKDMLKGVAFPTCVSVNNVIGHYSPLESEDNVVLADGDVVKIDLGCHIDGFICQGAFTVVVGAAVAEGRKADVIAAAVNAAECAHRLLRPGHKGSEITAAILKCAHAFKVNPVEGVLSHNMKQYIIDGNKAIINKETPEMKVSDFEIEENEVYGIDIVMSSGEGKGRDSEQRTTVFKRNVDQTYRVKMKASQHVFAEMNRRFPTMPFSLRLLGEEKTARLGITECIKNDLVSPYPVLLERDGEFVAQVKFTALVMPSVTHRLSTAPEVECRTENKIEDADLVALLNRSVKKTRKKATKKPAAAAASSSQ